MSNNNNRREKLVNGAQRALDQMKYEIATEFGVNLGAETASRLNGSVGGEITKRMVAFAEQALTQQMGMGGGAQGGGQGGSR